MIVFILVLLQQWPLLVLLGHLLQLMLLALLVVREGRAGEGRQD